MPQNIPPSGRRGFLTAAGALAALTLFRPGRGLAEVAHRTRAAPPWDLSWLDQLKGKHRQVFDSGPLTHGENPMHVVANWLDAQHEVYGLEGRDLSTIIGIAFPSFPINVGDAIWAKYEVGRRWELKDPATGQWATRNFYLGEGDTPKRDTVRAVHARGTVFWQCNYALRRIAQTLAHDTGQEPDAVRAELIAGFNPGVKVVPAHAMLLGLAQERGFAYQKL